MLTASDDITNSNIASDRVIVENFFGRLKTLWAVASDIYTWKRENYVVFYQTCVALTNAFIRFNSLRADGGAEYRMYTNRLLAIGANVKSKRSNTMSKYRFSALLPGVDSDNSNASADESGLFD
ncbi:hypothetical protein AeMF1_013864 [Aphanomyces euteiches]|nr:hypothetical protein AeMF1_013864 [Aphanomyces euteiches]KAH9191826.1 hypothetical protein AeNC1_006200 [Aphanomyces euteiches]